MNTCLVCGKQLSRAGAKFCSDAHRKQFGRMKTEAKVFVPKGAPESPEVTVPNIQDDDTPADKSWLKQVAHMGPDWPIRDPLTENTCTNCKKKFKTHFRLLRHCGCTV